MRPEYFTNQYGLIVDYLAEWLREMRKRNFGDAINKYFKLGRDLNQRDTIAVKHTVSGLLKLLYPNEQYDKEAVQALPGIRARVSPACEGTVEEDWRYGVFRRSLLHVVELHNTGPTTAMTLAGLSRCVPEPWPSRSSRRWSSWAA